MDILRKNSDYAIRALVNLGRKSGSGPVSARRVAEEEEVSYQLTCKIMQRLERAGLLRSMMGPAGGYELGKCAAEIRMSEIIALFQGPVRVKACLFEETSCPNSPACRLRPRLDKLQRALEEHLSAITLEDLVLGAPKPRSRRR